MLSSKWLGERSRAWTLAAMACSGLTVATGAMLTYETAYLGPVYVACTLATWFGAGLLLAHGCAHVWGFCYGDYDSDMGSRLRGSAALYLAILLLASVALGLSLEFNAEYECSGEVTCAIAIPVGQFCGDHQQFWMCVGPEDVDRGGELYYSRLTGDCEDHASCRGFKTKAECAYYHRPWDNKECDKEGRTMRDHVLRIYGLYAAAALLTVFPAIGLVGIRRRHIGPGGHYSTIDGQVVPAGIVITSSPGGIC